MALTVTNWALTTYAGVIDSALRESDPYGIANRGVYIYEPGGGDTKKFFSVTADESTNVAGGSNLIDNQSNVTETAPTINLDLPISTSRPITYDIINTYGGQVPTQYGAAQGRRHAEDKQNRMIAYLLKIATGDTSNSLSAGTDVRNDYTNGLANGVKVFDDDATDTDGTAVANAVLSAMAQLDIDKIPRAGRMMAIHPTYFAKLRKVTWIASTDFSASKTNEAAFDMFNFAGCPVVSLASVFGTDQSSNTKWSAKYRGNFSSVANSGVNGWGVVWHDQAVGIYEVETSRGLIDDIPLYNSWLVQTRCHRGLGTLRPTGVVAIAGD